MSRGDQDYREFFAFVDDLKRLSTPQDVLVATELMVARYGFERLLFAGLAPRKQQTFIDVVLAAKWPHDFLQLYVERNYLPFDPLVRLVIRSAWPFEWASKTYFDAEDVRAAEVMKAAADFGLVRGLVFPIHGPGGYEACVSMAGEDIELPPQSRAALHLMSLYAFERIRTLVGEPMARVVLSAREREVLRWAAEGKSAWEIGEILRITKRTVDEHIKNAGRKLGAANRTQAVAVALRDHLISV